MKKPLLALLALLGCLSLSPAFAQTSSTSAPPATSAPMAKQHSPQSIECSKEADAKGLHGKERKKFRKDCMHKAGGSMKKGDVD
ncbi:MAG TPA: PsiF family protein [Methylovirgula sp.]|nr:PsiF family protein [Methylovirgula sp.]